MVTIEVNLKEGDEQPEQHLDEGEFIERRVVLISDLYTTLQGKYELKRWHFLGTGLRLVEQHYRKRRARSWTQGEHFSCKSERRHAADVLKGSITGLSAFTGASASSHKADFLIYDQQTYRTKDSCPTSTPPSWHTAGITAKY
jgi:hypothetical protein